MSAVKKTRQQPTHPGFDTGLAGRLPPVRGRITENAPLGHMTWLRVGGPAEVLFKPADFDDLAAFLAACPDDVPVTVMGVASNTLVRDGGVPGVVIRLGRGFNGIEIDGDTVTAGAAALDLNVAMHCAENGLGGLEFLSGIPGTIGGALRMNAGAYGAETADVLVEAVALDSKGATHRLTTQDMNMGYRHNGAPADYIFTGCTLRGMADEPGKIMERIAKIKAAREETQPIRERTGGSTFANPSQDDPSVAHKSWELIDAAGCRGLTVGGAQMSEKHCNFMINTGDATAEDIETLGETVRARVLENSGIDLRWEIRRIGITMRELGSLAHVQTKGTA